MLSSLSVFCIPHADEFNPPMGIFRSKRTIIDLILFICTTGEFHPFVTTF